MTFIGIYRNDFEEKVFEELRKSVSSLEENRKKEKIKGSSISQIESGLYPYLKNNKEKYNLDDNKNLQKSKVDFILDNLSDICSNEIEINVMSKYLYYIRLIRRVFKENPIGDYKILTCKYKNGEPEDIVLLLLLKMEDKNFSYLLPSEKEKFYEVPIKELKEKIKDVTNPLILYNRPYQIKTGPLTEKESDHILEELDRD